MVAGVWVLPLVESSGHEVDVVLDEGEGDLAGLRTVLLVAALLQSFSFVPALRTWGKSFRSTNRGSVAATRRCVDWERV